MDISAKPIVTLRQLKAAAAKAGVTVRYSSSRKHGVVERSLEMFAPPAHVFADIDLHSTYSETESWIEHDEPWDFRPELENIQSIEPCTDPDCELCKLDDGDDVELAPDLPQSWIDYHLQRSQRA